MRIDSGHLLGNGRYERLQSINRHGPRHDCQHLGSCIRQHPRKDALPVVLLHILWEPQKCLSAPYRKKIKDQRFRELGIVKVRPGVFSKSACEYHTGPVKCHTHHCQMLCQYNKVDAGADTMCTIWSGDLTSSRAAAR